MFTFDQMAASQTDVLLAEAELGYRRAQQRVREEVHREIQKRELRLQKEISRAPRGAKLMWQYIKRLNKTRKKINEGQRYEWRGETNISQRRLRPY